MNNLNDAAEIAFAAYLTTIVGGSAGGNCSVFTGKNADIKTVPCVICASDGAEDQEDPKFSGNYWIDMSVIVKSPASQDIDAQGAEVDPKAPDVALVDQVLNALQVTNLDQLVNTPDFFIFNTGYLFSSPKTGRDENGIWVSELPIRIYCCGRSLT